MGREVVMRQYQEQYCENTGKVHKLLGRHTVPEDRPEDFYRWKLEECMEIRRQ